MSCPARLLMAAYDRFGYAFRRRHLPAPVKVERICVISLNNIGDAVLTLPMVAAIASLFPEARVTMLTKPASTELLATCPDIDEALGLDPYWKASARESAGLSKSGAVVRTSLDALDELLCKLDPQLVVACEPDWMLNRELARLRIPYAAGFVEAGGGFHLNIPTVSPTYGQQAQRIFALATNVATALNFPKPAFKPAELQPQAPSVTTALKEAGVDPKKLIILHPVSTARTKDWLPESWAEVIAALKKEGWQPASIGGKGTALPGTVDFCGRFSLVETAALLIQARLFIGVDSGPGHIATASGCPVISLFSSVNDPARWAPTGKPGQVTVLYKEVADRATYPLNAGQLPEGTKGNPYIDQITPAEVLAAAKRLLA